MPVRLVSLDDGSSIVLDKPILLLGRHPECDIQIESRKVSRRHCCIAQVDNAVLIRDLGSTNGIKINGVRVHEARLSLGDEVVIGNHRYRVASDSVPQQPVVPAAGPVLVRRPVPERAHDNDHTFDEDALIEASEVPIPLEDGEQSSPEQAPAEQAPAEEQATEQRLDVSDLGNLSGSNSNNAGPRS